MEVATKGVAVGVENEAERAAKNDAVRAMLRNNGSEANRDAGGDIIEENGVGYLLDGAVLVEAVDCAGGGEVFPFGSD